MYCIILMKKLACVEIENSPIKIDDYPTHQFEIGIRISTAFTKKLDVNGCHGFIIRDLTGLDFGICRTLVLHNTTMRCQRESRVHHS